MPDKKISELPDATLPIASGVKFEAVQGGVNVKVDADDMPGSGAAGVQSVTGDGVDNTDPDNPVIDLSAYALLTDLTAAKSIMVAVTDEVTNIGTGTALVSFRMPYALTLTAVRASLVTAQASGNIFTVDINEAGTTILSTKLTIDNTETTSVTAVTPPVISDTALADDALITVDVDQIGDGSAIGLKITLIGT
jgi:hypothetical protein